MEDYVGTPTVHGIGPCIGIFEELRSTGLHLTFVYPTPLISPALMRHTVEQAMEYLVAAADSARAAGDVANGEDDVSSSDSSEAHTASGKPVDAREGGSPDTEESRAGARGGAVLSGAAERLPDLLHIGSREGEAVSAADGSPRERQCGGGTQNGVARGPTYGGGNDGEGSEEEAFEDAEDFELTE